ncbi:threonine-phosphate decarboxylase [Sphingobium bisphenolivorans]|uniref:threonine-phosphate decarboxylase n=1 Tax=Sphingobium bisphenolivorans TaxID=1335760 RepID=UPI00039B0967|nr:threonine-phosphate decarboxylase [Sphingobium bisphenolivorans]
MSGFTWHGGRLAEARAVYGEGEWIDLSTGINPIPWPGVCEVEIDWTALPDPEALMALEQTAAAHFDVDAAHVCAIPGSEIGLRLLGRMLDLPARFLVPSYRTHGEVFARSRPISGGEYLPDEPTALLLANPNNPDGRIFPAERLLHWLDELERREGWLIVDEAYADAVPGSKLAEAVGDDRRLILLRSFGKFFGLPGVRLGFLIAPRAIVAGARQMLGEWPVSAAAVALGTAAYRDRGWIEAMTARLPRQAARLDALLAQYGFAARGNCPLFRLLEVEDGHALFDRLARRAILTRPFADHPRWLRIGLPGDEAAWSRLESALADG